MRLSLLPMTIGLVPATLLTIHVLPRLASVLLLVFAGIILAVVLDALTATLRRVMPGGSGNRPVWAGLNFYPNPEIA